MSTGALLGQLLAGHKKRHPLAKPPPVDLKALHREMLKVNARAAIFKTVATFGGLTRRRLWVKNGDTAQTDGHEILAPLDDPYAYRLVEHELAHILFQSNARAREFFVSGLIQQANHALVSNNLPLLIEDEFDAYKELINAVVGVLEDARVESLWGLLYPGSALIMTEMHRERIKPQLKNTHRTLASFLVIASTGIEVPQGQYSRYKPALDEALQKVARRSFTATLLVSKWLLQKLVDESVRARRGLRHNPKAQHAARTLAARALNRQIAKEHGQPVEEPVEKTEFETDPVGATPAERRAALARLVEFENTPAALTNIADDWQPPKYTKSGEAQAEEKQGRLMANAALGLKTDDASLSAFLSESETKMQEQLEQIRVAIAKKIEDKNWLTKNVPGKVNLHDIDPAPKDPTTPEDKEHINRLRALFYRVQGRRRTSLHDTGSDIDVLAYVEMLVSKQFVPCFRESDRGRGFKALVLIDRSSSMKGKKSAEAERACRILSRALDFPFVKFDVWGFQSREDGELDLTRFDTSALSFSGKRAALGGHTPLHLALRVATRYLTTGDEAKQVLVITDGFPSFSLKNGDDLATRTLMRFVREEVLHARRVGVNVNSVVIDDRQDNPEEGMSDDGLSFMFGSRRSWHRVEQGRLGDGLVRVVTSSFTQYLRNG